MPRPRQVVLAPEARAHLRAIRQYIAARSSAATATRFTAQLAAYCLSFDLFPERGSLHEDILPGLRLVGFRGRATVAFRVFEDRVEVLGIYYGGRNIEAHLRGHDPA